MGNLIMREKQPIYEEEETHIEEVKEEEVFRRNFDDSPFISEKKIKGHTETVFESTTVTNPDGQKRIITCSFDRTLRIFNLEEEKTENIFTHTTSLYSVHFYKEEQLLMTTDWNGELLVFKLFPEIKIIKKIKVSQRNSVLWKLIQISSTDFICCVESGVSIGNLYKIKFNKNNSNNNSWISEEIEYPTYNKNKKKEDISCIYQLINKKNIIMFAGGNSKDKGGEDFTIKSVNLNNNNNFKRFPKKHTYYINCLTSYINTKNEEIILSGSGDKRIMFWDLRGNCLMEMEMKFIGILHCFLNDFSRNRVFVVSGDTNDIKLHSFILLGNPRFMSFSGKNEKKVWNIHSKNVYSLKWIDDEYQNKFISCSSDGTFNIFELEEVEEWRNCDRLEGVSDHSIKFKNKNIKFWSIFMNQITEKEETLQKFEQLETNINEKTILSIILGIEVEIPSSHLPDYYYFFKKLNLKHCIALIIQKIEEIMEIENLERVYFFFKKFCQKYENEVIKSWFRMNVKKQHTTFNTSFALSLFNKMKMKQITIDDARKMIDKDTSFGTIWSKLGKYKMKKPIDHKDFEGVGKLKELNVENYFKKLNDKRDSTFNLTLISTDKKEFKVHKEILVLRLNFFFRLFKFRGLEVTEYENTEKITLVDLMSSDVVECLISYAYFGNLDLKMEGMSLSRRIDIFCRLLLFCDQYEEKQLMRKIRNEFKNFVKNFNPSKMKDQLQQEEKRSEYQNFLRSLSEISSFLVGNDKVLGIIIPLITKLGLRISGVEKFIEELFLRSLEVKGGSLYDENEMEEKRKLQKRNKELEKMIAKMNDDKGVGKGQKRDNLIKKDEKDEEQPKKKKRKLNKK